MERNKYTYHYTPCLCVEINDNEVFTPPPPTICLIDSLLVVHLAFACNLFVCCEHTSYLQFIHASAQHRQIALKLSILQRRTGELPQTYPFCGVERTNHPASSQFCVAEQTNHIKSIHAATQNRQTASNLYIHQS